MVTIILQPIGAVDPDAIAFLDDELRSIFGAVEVRLEVKAPADSLNPQGYNRPAPVGEAEDEVCIRDEEVLVDHPQQGAAFAGLRQREGSEERRPLSLAPLARLRQEFYGLPSDPGLFRERAKKEAVHELGHVFGLLHCPDQRCVMHFSNSIAETDLKGWRLCGRCREMLEDSGVVLSI